MKIIYHIPAEQYGFVELEDEVKNSEIDAEKVVKAYRTISNAFKPKVGAKLRKAEVADPLNHIDVTLPE